MTPKTSSEATAFAANLKDWPRDARTMVNAFSDWLAGNPWACGADHYEARRQTIRTRLPELRGKNLACWCKQGQPCHADVLLDLANRPVCEEVTTHAC